jgi:hypothetical protein
LLSEVSVKARFCLCAVAAAAILVAAAGCGSSNGSTESTHAAVAKRAALDRKLASLRRKLDRRRAALRAQRTRERRRAARQAAAATESQPSASNSALATDFAAVAGLEGEVGATIGAPGSRQVVAVGDLSSGSAWSTSKLPIALRLLQDVGGPSGLSAAQVDEMRRALTLSDNDAAAALFADLERKHGGLAEASVAVGEVLREAGDGTTEISTQGRDGFSTYGQTDWSLANQQLFMSKLAAKCIGSTESDEYVLGLMGEVSSDSWGLGSAGLPARWKGGWGPGTDGRYLVRQMGILEVGGKQAVVTLAAIPSNGQFETAEQMATTIAQWLAKQAPHYAATPNGC